MPGGRDVVDKAATDGVQEVPRLDSPLWGPGGARARPCRHHTPRRRRFADVSGHVSRGSDDEERWKRGEEKSIKSSDARSGSAADRDRRRIIRQIAIKVARRQGQPSLCLDEGRREDETRGGAGRREAETHGGAGRRVGTGSRGMERQGRAAANECA